MRRPDGCRTASPPDLFVSKFARDYAFIGAGLTMQLSEVIFIYGPTTDSERDTLEKHLEAKFSIP